MTISYNKALTGVGVLAALAVVGGVLLGLGMAGGQIGTYGGHTWQIATGGSLLGLGLICGGTLLNYMHKSRTYGQVTDGLAKDKRTHIWTYVWTQNGEEMMIKDKSGFISVVERKQDLLDLKKLYTRVIVPFG